MNWGRVFWLTLALGACVALLTGYLVFRSPSPPQLDRAGHWLKVPIDMDARSWGMRFLLNRVLDADDSMSRQCYGPDPERYAIHIAESWFTEHREDWLIRLQRSGERFDVLVADASVVAPPPHYRSNARLFGTPDYYSMTVAELDDLRQSLESEALWRAPQSDLACTDGPSIVIEACVDGQYYARARTCEPGVMEQQDAVWTALRRHFRSPPAKYGLSGTEAAL